MRFAAPLALLIALSFYAAFAADADIWRKCESSSDAEVGPVNGKYYYCCCLPTLEWVESTTAGNNVYENACKPTLSYLSCSATGQNYLQDQRTSTCTLQDVPGNVCRSPGSLSEGDGCNADYSTNGSSPDALINSCGGGATTYFADKVSSVCTAIDRGDNICHSSGYLKENDGCTAAAECNGIAVGQKGGCQTNYKCGPVCTCVTDQCILSQAQMGLIDLNSNSYADAAETVAMSASYTGTCPSGSNIYFQIDARSADGSCNIQYSGGTMPGITKQNPSQSPTAYTGTWTIPVIPAACRGKTVNAYASAIWDGAPGAGTQKARSSATGSMMFPPAPTATPTPAATPTPTPAPTATPTPTPSLRVTLSADPSLLPPDGTTTSSIIALVPSLPNPASLMISFSSSRGAQDTFSPQTCRVSCVGGPTCGCGVTIKSSTAGTPTITGSASGYAPGTTTVTFAPPQAPIYISYTASTGLGGAFASDTRAWMVKSYDDGTTWGAPKQIAASDTMLVIANGNALHGSGENTLFAVYTGEFWPVVGSIEAFNQRYTGVKFARSVDDGKTWTSPTIIESTIRTSNPYYSTPSIYAVDANTVYASYSAGTLRFAKSVNGGSTWTTKEIDASGNDSSIYADSAGNVFVAYVDRTTKYLKLAKSTDRGETWSSEVLVAFQALHPSISGSGNSIFLSFSFVDDGFLRSAVSKDSGNTWAFRAKQKIDTSRNYYSSVYALNANTAFLSYYLDGLSNSIPELSFTALYVYPLIYTTSWVDGTGGNPESSTSVNIGYYHSITAPNRNTPMVSYYDSTNNRLKFTKSTDGGLTWPASNVKSITTGGMYNSIYSAKPQPCSSISLAFSPNPAVAGSAVKPIISTSPAASCSGNIAYVQLGSDRVSSCTIGVDGTCNGTAFAAPSSPTYYWAFVDLNMDGSWESAENEPSVSMVLLDILTAGPCGEGNACTTLGDTCCAGGKLYKCV